MNESVYLPPTPVSIRTLREDVEAAAGCDATVLITGERGVGRNTVAQLIHLQNHRGRRPLVTIDCAADVGPETFERLDVARSGTILLDHVDELSPEMQARLMVFLDCARPLLDVRLIAAAGCDLHDKVAAGEWGKDLYYRLNVIHLVVPASERRDGEPLATTMAC